MRPDYTNARIITARYRTGADIVTACRELGMSPALMGREIGRGARSMESYARGDSQPSRETLLAIQCVHDLYMQRRAAIDAGADDMPHLETVT